MYVCVTALVSVCEFCSRGGNSSPYISHRSAPVQKGCRDGPFPTVPQVLSYSAREPVHFRFFPLDSVFSARFYFANTSPSLYLLSVFIYLEYSIL